MGEVRVQGRNGKFLVQTRQVLKNMISADQTGFGNLAGLKERF
jgi:hypothetical protein